MGTVGQFPGAEEQPESNCHRVLAGTTLSDAEILAGWQRIVKIVMPHDGEPADRTMIQLPAVRRWDKELVIVDASARGLCSFRTAPTSSTATA
jgi:hypothetical protein